MSGSNSNNNAKKKQEEKHLKLLREFLALPSNKNCFDCNQRGPTYVNATVGSFVCISCSGKLRGLTPPHRVKSISMASFTPEEIDFLRSKGNEYCKQVWMALYTGDIAAETKDDQRFKDHLTAKYEKRRWYVEPNAATRNLHQVKSNGMNGSTASSTGSSPSPSARTPTPAPAPAPVPAPAPQPSKTSDLLADLDFFSTPLTTVASTATPRKNPSIPQSISQPSFANFQNADFFVASFPPNLSPAIPPPAVPATLQQQQPSGSQAIGMLSPPKDTPSEDRYSALKDLDALFTAQQSETPTSGTAINWGSSSTWNSSTTSVFSPRTNETQFGTPPASTWKGASSVAPQPAPAPSIHSSNPFLAATTPVTQPQVPASQPINLAGPALPWANFSSSPHSQFNAFNNFNGLNGLNGLHSHPPVGVTQLTTSQSLNLSPKTWNSSPAGHNPFMENSSFAKGRSHNPFL